MHLTSLVYLDVKLHVGGFLGACANKTYLLFGPPGITPDAGMLRSGVYKVKIKAEGFVINRYALKKTS
jgi:hypothetical protein